MKCLDGNACVEDSYLPVTVGNVSKWLYCFIMALFHPSGAFAGVFACLFDEKGLSPFLKGHDEAFSHIGGVPRRIWYSPLPLVVKTGHSSVTIQENLATYASQRGFEVRVIPLWSPMAVARTEIALRHVRRVCERREWTSMEELNQALRKKFSVMSPKVAADSDVTTNSPRTSTDEGSQANA